MHCSNYEAIYPMFFYSKLSNDNIYSFIFSMNLNYMKHKLKIKIKLFHLPKKNVVNENETAFTMHIYLKINKFESIIKYHLCVHT